MNYALFDLLALPLWIFLIIDAIYSLKKDKNWRVYARLIIGIIAFIADFIFAFLKPFG
jgi:hypothetical protein